MGNDTITLPRHTRTTLAGAVEGSHDGKNWFNLAQPATQPCRSPYCECEPGKCTHPGLHDARHDQPATQQEQKLPEFFAQVEGGVVSVYRRREDATPELIHREELPAPAGEPVAQPTCVAIIEVFDREWHMKYLSLPVGTHKLYPQQYTFTAPQPRKLTDKELEVVIYEHTKLNPNQQDDRELIGYIIKAVRSLGIGGQA